VPVGNMSSNSSIIQYSYNDYRKTFKTVLIKNKCKPDGEADTLTANQLKKITYSSSVGELVAYQQGLKILFRQVGNFHCS
jgi:hypothetical protein